MPSENTPFRWHQRVLKPGLILLAAGLLLLGATLAFPAFWEVARGEWNERGLLVYWAQLTWVPFAVIGGILVSINRLYAWPVFRLVVMGFLIWLCVAIYEDMGKVHDRLPVCPSNQTQIVMAMQMYAMDHNMMLPPSWEALDLPTKLLKCHGDESPGARWGGYGLNAHIVGQPIDKLTSADETLLTADSITPNSIITSPADIARRHHGKYVAAFADGHIEGLDKDVPLELK